MAAPAENSGVQRGALSICLLASVVSVGAAVASWVNDYVNEDQALLWAAAEGWQHLRPMQPNFWGQSYGTTFEAIPAALLNLVGFGYANALPMAIAAMNLSMWLVLGWATYRTGRLGWAAAAFGAIALLSTEHLVITTTFNTVAGRLVGCVAAALYLRWPDERRAVLASIAVGAFAVALEPAVAILVAPLAIYQITAWWRLGRGRDRRAEIAWLLAAGTPSLAWMALTRWWYDRYPAQALHPAPQFTPDWTRLRDSLDEPSRHFGAFVPELAPASILPLLAIVALVVVAAWTRSLRRLAASAALIATLAIALASPKSVDYFNTPLFAAERIVLALVPAVWFVAAVEPWPAVAGGRRWVPPAAIVLATLCVLSTGWRALHWDTEMGGQHARAVAETRYAVTPVSTIRGRCEVARASTGGDVRYVVFQDRTTAYACAVYEPEFLTVFPPYERRTWRLTEFLSANDADFLVIGTPPTCPPTLACETTSSELTWVTLPEGVRTDDALWAMAIPIRAPFERYP